MQLIQNKYEMRMAGKETERTAKERAVHMKRIARWGIFAVSVVAVVGAVVWIVKQTPDGGITRLVDLGTAIEHAKGPASAPVQLVEYSDFQCPACRVYYPIVKELGKQFPNDLKIIYRHFPLERTHPNANIAGRAAEAAGAQGKFWEMHDIIFERQDEWSKDPSPTNLFVGYARSIGLNENQFRADMNSPGANDNVHNDFESGVASGVNSTPTFFINGTKIQNPRSYDEFRVLIQRYGASG